MWSKLLVEFNAYLFPLVSRHETDIGIWPPPDLGVRGSEASGKVRASPHMLSLPWQEVEYPI